MRGESSSVPGSRREPLFDELVFEAAFDLSALIENAPHVLDEAARSLALEGPPRSIVPATLLGASRNGSDGHGRKTVLAGTMGVARASHTATLLTDGRILVVGGEREGAEESGTLESAEIWDPVSLRFAPTGSMSMARRDHHAVLLGDGSVAVVGGAMGSDPVEIWNPQSERWSKSPTDSRPPCSNRELTLLSGQRLLMAERCLSGKAKVSSGYASARVVLDVFVGGPTIRELAQKVFVYPIELEAFPKVELD